MFLSLDGTFWVQLINFAIFFAILNVVFLRPVGDAIKKRRAHIEGVQADYDRYARQVAMLRGEAEQKRASARREADETIASARSAAENEAAALTGDYAAQAQALVDDARAVVTAEVAAAKTRESILSQSLADKLLARALGDDK